MMSATTVAASRTRSLAAAASAAANSRGAAASSLVSRLPPITQIVNHHLSVGCPPQASSSSPPQQHRGSAAAAAASPPGLFEIRTYVIEPKLLSDYLRRCADTSHVRRRLNPGFLGFWITETGGDVNEVTHAYHYEDYDHRDAVRGAMGKDGEWRAFLAATKPALVSQKSEIFLPATAALVRGEMDVFFFVFRFSFNVFFFEVPAV